MGARRPYTQPQGAGGSSNNVDEGDKRNGLQRRQALSEKDRFQVKGKPKKPPNGKVVLKACGNQSTQR